MLKLSYDGGITMHKWITKREINKILKTYSTQKDEFLPVEGKEHFYQSQLQYQKKRKRENIILKKQGELLCPMPSGTAEKASVISGNAGKSVSCSSNSATLGTSQLLI